MKTVRQTLLEGAALVLIACAISLGANSVRQRGLDLGRDYFKAPPPTEPLLPLEASSPGSGGNDPDEAPPAEGHENRLVNCGMVELTLEQVRACFRNCDQASGASDPRILFVDARNDECFTEGHIPGAVLLDHYYMDEYIADVLATVECAEQIVVYCNGIECEDGALVCLDLIDEGIAADKLFLFKGGWEAWVQAGLPCEQGEP